MKHFKAIGLMSGSSLDGLDMAYCSFQYMNNQWHYRIEKSATLPYSADWKNILNRIRVINAKQLSEYHQQYGKLLGELTVDFIKENKLSPDLIAAHGHTVFHYPEKGYSFQLGNGQTIATLTGITTVSDFRTKDILLGGQGAPLVPIGDALLFSEYDYCLNLGGIGNISFDEKGKRKGYDICPVNQLLNYLSRQMGEAYDNNGYLAQLGKMYKPLFEALNKIPYYLLPYPKSLSNEYIDEHFFGLLDSFDISIENKLYTTVKHIAFQINKAISIKRQKQILITGGGTHNRFLIKTLRQNSGFRFVVPSKQLVDFKEALIFAFMGILRINNEVNCLSSVTGASNDSSSGIIYYP